MVGGVCWKCRKGLNVCKVVKMFLFFCTVWYASSSKLVRFSMDYYCVNKSMFFIFSHIRIETGGKVRYFH